jgi:K+-transporting ATPase c subunit
MGYIYLLTKILAFYDKGNITMKKAKVILSVVAVLAVVGGAFAFKTSRVASSLYTTNAAGACITERFYNTQLIGVTTFASATTKPLYYNSLCTITVPTTTTVQYTTLPGM